MTDDEFIKLMEANDYLGTRKLASGEWAAVQKFLYTWGLVVGLDEFGRRTRFCYRLMQDAFMALEDWNGHGDPPGNWIKEKGRVERDNPAMFKGVPVVNEHGH